MARFTAPIAPSWVAVSSAGPTALKIQRVGGGEIFVQFRATMPAGAPAQGDVVHVIGDDHPSIEPQNIAGTTLIAYVQSVDPLRSATVFATEGL